MRITKRKVLFLLVIGLFAITSVSWAYGQTLRLKINVNSKTLPSGRAAEVIPMTDKIVYTSHKNKLDPQKKAGHELFEIKLADPTLAELAQIYLSVDTNGKVKSGWWVRAGLYYEIDPSKVNGNYDDILFLNDKTTIVKKFPEPVAEEHLLTEDADGLLMTGGLPTDAKDGTKIYVIGSYQNPGGNTSPGKQGTLNEIQFHCMVRF